MIDDNFHYGDEEERYQLGEFPTLEAAVDAARQVVDEYLRSAFQSGISADELHASYLMFGEDPFIVSTDPAVSSVLFSARDYARLRCEEICRAPDEPGRRD